MVATEARVGRAQVTAVEVRAKEEAVVDWVTVGAAKVRVAVAAKATGEKETRCSNP